MAAFVEGLTDSDKEKMFDYLAEIDEASVSGVKAPYVWHYMFAKFGINQVQTNQVVEAWLAQVAEWKVADAKIGSGRP